MLARLLPTLLTMLALGVTTPGTIAQELDNTWFKVTMAVKGAGVDSSGETSKTKGKITAYMNVRLPPQALAEGAKGPFYNFTLYSEVAPGTFGVTGIGTFLTSADGRIMIGPSQGLNNAGVRFEVVVPDKDNTNLVINFVASLNIKTDKQGQFKNANFKSLGGVIPEGFGGDETLYGGAKVRGKSVPVEKLPFNPDA